MQGADLVALAAERQSRGQHDGALAAIGAGIALEPGSTGLHLLQGMILRGLGKPQAESGLLRASATAANDSRPHVQLGGCHESAGRLRRALQSFRRAAALEPAYSETWVGLARLAYENEEARLTMTYRARALVCDAKADVGLLLVMALIALGRWREVSPLLEADLVRRRGPGAVIVPETTAAKMGHDAEQIEYLVGLGRLPPSMAETAAFYRHLQGLLPKEGNPTVTLQGEAWQRVAPTYNRVLYRDPGAAIDGPAVNPALDADAIARAYFSSRPEMAVIDDLLTPDALAALLRYCRESTVWFTSAYSGGYVGAYVGDGFAAPILFHIADELKARLSAIIGDAGLHQLWAFKYDSRLTGIALHGDAARINVNFWITPDEANLDPTSGGLEVYDVAAPPDWNFNTYNGDLAAIRAYLDRTGSRSIVVPHRQNRAVLFNSDLFHRTGDIHFREGYLNRRINVTMLFGTRRTQFLK